MCGLSWGYPGTDMSLSAQLTDFTKVMIMALMIGGRHRGLPYALDPAVHLPSIFSAKPVARPAVAGLDLASIDRKSSFTFFGPMPLGSGLDAGAHRASARGLTLTGTVSRNQATLTRQQLTTLRRALAGGNVQDTVQLTFTRTAGRASTLTTGAGGTAGRGGQPKRPALRGVKWLPSADGEAEQAVEMEKEQERERREGESGIEMVAPRDAGTPRTPP